MKDQRAEQTSRGTYRGASVFLAGRPAWIVREETDGNGIHTYVTDTGIRCSGELVMVGTERHLILTEL